MMYTYFIKENAVNSRKGMRLITYLRSFLFSKETVDKSFLNKYDKFGEVMSEGRLTVPSDGKIFRLQEAILLLKKLGRPLSQEEMKQFELGFKGMNMVTLRSFKNADAKVLQQYKYTNMSIKEIQDMICDWNTLEFDGKYFEMFAVENNGELVGTISLYQKSDNVISIGPEIFPAFQRQGFGKEAMNLSLEVAKSRGYKIVVQQIQRNNIPSITMHKSLAFETDNYYYTNRKEKEVLIFLKPLL